MGRPRYKRTLAEAAHGEHQEQDDIAVPVVLPHVAMDIAEDGRMTVTVDGAPHEPEPLAPPWRREDFAPILDHLTDQHHAPVRVEVREADGSVFTDIITPGKHRRSDPEPQEPAPALPKLLVLHGDGFVPGEDVAVAVVIAHSDAEPDGIARGQLTPDRLASSPTREVVLLGRVSGAVTVGHPE